MRDRYRLQSEMYLFYKSCELGKRKTILLITDYQDIIAVRDFGNRGFARRIYCDDVYLRGVTMPIGYQEPQVAGRNRLKIDDVSIRVIISDLCALYILPSVAVITGLPRKIFSHPSRPWGFESIHILDTVLFSPRSNFTHWVCSLGGVACQKVAWPGSSRSTIFLGFCPLETSIPLTAILVKFMKESSDLVSRKKRDFAHGPTLPSESWALTHQ